MSGGAVVVRRQNQLIRAFRQAGAVSLDTARSLDELGLRESWVFRRMAARGVFIHTDGGRWSVSEPAADAFVRRRRVLMLSFVALAILIWVLVIALM
jgi:hypothetical protein